MVKLETIIKAMEHELEKTHDGTSSGPMRLAIQDCIEKVSGSNFRHDFLYDSEGKLIMSDKHHDSSKQIIANNMISSMQGKDKNLIISGGADHEDTNVWERWYDERPEMRPYIRGNYPNDKLSDPATLARQDMEQLVLKNPDGEYAVRSVTRIAQDGSSMTVVRNNDFGPEDEKIYNAKIKEFLLGCQDFEDQRFDAISDRRKELTGDYETKEAQARKEVTEEMGTFSDYIRTQSEQLEKDCNIKVKFNMNEKTKYKGKDDSDEHYDARFSPQQQERIREGAYGLHLRYEDPDRYERITNGEEEAPSQEEIDEWYYSERD